MDKMLAEILDFVNERDWKQFHKPKDVAISLSLEAAEVLEHFQWKTEAEFKKYLRAHKQEVADEIIDVLYWTLLLSHYLKIDLKSAFKLKMKQNRDKYPVHKAKGSHAKHTTFQD